MEKAREIGNIALWLVGHLAFTIIINLTALGGWFCYQKYQEVYAAPTEIAFQDMEMSQLKEIQKQLGYELKFREGKG